MERVALVLVVIVLLLLINRPSSSYSYRVRGPLFTPAERSFLGVLDLAVADKYRVFGKVRVGDVISFRNGMSRKNWQIKLRNYTLTELILENWVELSKLECVELTYMQI